MTAPTVNVVRALDDHLEADLQAIDTEIRTTLAKLATLYRQRTEREALRDLRDAMATPEEVSA